MFSNLPRQMSTFFVNCHFRTLELVQFLPDGRFVFWSQTSPWFVSFSVIILCLRHLDIVIEPDDLKPKIINSISFYSIKPTYLNCLIFQKSLPSFLWVHPPLVGSSTFSKDIVSFLPSVSSLPPDFALRIIININYKITQYLSDKKVNLLKGI